MPPEETTLTIAEVSSATGLTAHTLRYYERAGLLPPVARSASNRRRYVAADVEWLRFLVRLRETGMPIVQMRQYARLRERGAATTDERLRMLQLHQSAVREQIARLHTHEKALADKIAIYRGILSAPTTADPTGADHD